MKHIIFIFNIALLFSITFLSGASLSAQSPSGRAYPTGIYIFCGREIPRNFHYLIEKKEAGGQWTPAAQLRAPQNAAALQTGLLNLPPSIKQNMPLPLDLSDFLFTQQSKSMTIDSLYFYASDPKILAAVGCGWFDDGLSAPGTYQYRVSRVYPSGAVELGQLSQRFPQNNYEGTLNILQFRPQENVVTLYYGLSDTTATYSLKLYRSGFLENNYKEVPSTTVYENLNGQMVAVTQDEGVAKGMVYSYMAIPYDHLGNMGRPSDTINVYNLIKTADIGYIWMNALAEKEKRGVNLSWKVDTDFYIQGFELYRSNDYNTGYERIVTLPAGTLSYLDTNIDPAESYFYFVVMNNGFGGSVPSARVAVILEGSNPNVLPPQGLTISLRENLVELSFQSIESDTRSYQIYRGEGYTGELSLIAAFEAGDAVSDATVTFVDTLALTVHPQIYSYAVADVNTSYNVSPLSNRVSIQFSGGMLPIPSITEAQLRGDEVLVIWNDLSGQNAFVAGYNVWRSAQNSQGATVEEPQMVATLPHHINSYTDTLLTPDTQYRYVLESFSLDGEKSSQSLHAGVTVPPKFPLPPGQISAIPSPDRVMLRWDNPLDPTITGIRIYRSTLEEPASLLTTLTADHITFEDRTAKKGVQYFYYIATVNDRGKESKPDEPVSARIR